MTVVYRIVAIVLLGVMGRPEAFAEGAPTIPLVGAHYSVPVSPDLASLASFKLNNVTLSEGTSGLTVTYHLPPEIAGLGARNIHLSPSTSESPGAMQLMLGSMDADDGPSTIGEASCGRHPINPKKVFCMVMYHSLRIDAAAVKAYLEAISQGPKELAMRRQVAAAFQNEPVGVLLLELQ